MSSRSPSPRASSPATASNNTTADGTTPDGTAPGVEIRGLGRAYTTSTSATRPALADIDVTVAAGQFTAIIGPSGCGKSTLLRLIGGLDDPDQGTVAVGGQDPRIVRRAGVIGFVPQTPALLPWRSVAGNVALLDQIGRWDHRRLGSEAVDEWLRRVGLEGEGDLLPHQLSGGMQQRAALARAFAVEPSLLLMDEPFSALDEMTRHQMQTLLVDLCQQNKPTVIFITHSIDEAVKLADRVLVLAGTPGAIVADIPIDLARPRTAGIEDAVEFRAYASEVRSGLMSSATDVAS